LGFVPKFNSLDCRFAHLQSSAKVL